MAASLSLEQTLAHVKQEVVESMDETDSPAGDQSLVFDVPHEPSPFAAPTGAFDLGSAAAPTQMANQSKAQRRRNKTGQKQPASPAVRAAASKADDERSLLQRSKEEQGCS